jgi:hypothetical protein
MISMDILDIVGSQEEICRNMKDFEEIWIKLKVFEEYWRNLTGFKKNTRNLKKLKKVWGVWKNYEEI